MPCEATSVPASVRFGAPVSATAATSRVVWLPTWSVTTARIVVALLTVREPEVALRPQLPFGHSCVCTSRETNGTPGTLSLRVKNSSRTTPERSACGEALEPSVASTRAS